MQTNYTKEELEAVEKILTNPIFIGFSKETIRVRRNLLTIAFFVVIYKLSKLKISCKNGFSFLGINFETVPSNEFLDISLFLLVLYHLIHFVWQSIDAWKECKLRVTGTNALFMKNDNKKTSSCDFTKDLRQTSLLNWWWKQRGINLTNDIIQVKKVLKKLKLKYNKNETVTSIQLEEKIKTLTEYVADLNNAVNSKRTLVSLKRFENFCELFFWSQKWRWYILEFGVPVGLALFAMSQTYQPLLIWVLNFPCL
jgi:hypothetical protein